MARKEKGLVSIPCFEPLSPGFVPAKPIQMGEYDPLVIEELQKKNQLVITLKEDGFKLYAVKSANGWKLYTDGIRDVSAYVPHIIEDLSRRPIPEGTMFIGEGMLYLDDKKSDLSGPQQIFNMKDPVAAVIKQIKIGKLNYMIFYVAFWNGESWFQKPYWEHIDKIFSNFTMFPICPVETLSMDLAKAKKLIEKSGAEGLVLYDSQFVSSYRLDGKDPERVAGCYKWKPEFEDDFIAYGYNPSEKDSKLAKEVKLAQIEKKTGRLIDCGKYGAFSRAERMSLVAEKYPLVLKLTFTKRHKSGKLREPKKPVFRTDKLWRHCVTGQVFPDVKYLTEKEANLKVQK